MANIQFELFSGINLGDSFFDSLRQDYQDFDNWYNKKALQDEKAYVLYEKNELVCFLYLKEENPVDNTSITPPLDSTTTWVKVGTFKVVPHRTKLGERLIKRIFDFAISKNIFNLYLTTFPKHETLISLLEQYGFKQWGKKDNELVLTKNIATTSKEIQQDICLDFPSINTKNVNKYILGIYPQYHTRMFSDSMLKTENFNILRDSSESNSIHKVYITKIQGIENIKKGDLLIIYRTKDKNAPNANYSAVATSLCVVEEYKHISSFTEEEFIKYCNPYNIFTEAELRRYYKTRQFPKIIKMTYNISFKKKVILDTLRKIVKREKEPYWGFVSLDDNEFQQILKAGGINESIIIY
ncbi:hypothetical protein [Campylobacter helveticus]|uniref:hypothetical protein n=1 Tax=Campylobacter helveticus TaxID=28898 RepID=UPI0022EABD43|nr:hypothetical protein [Campylobacter helveticus]